MKRKITINKKALSEVLFFVLLTAGLLFAYLIPKSEGLRAVLYIMVMTYAVSKFSSWLFEDDL